MTRRDIVIRFLAQRDGRADLDQRSRLRYGIEADELLAVLSLEGGTSARSSLTPRELQVLRMYDRGGLVHEIAEDLGVTTHTVNTHLASARRSFNVSTTEAAVECAKRQGSL